jgi:small subunit ribosomal protein S6e
MDIKCVINDVKTGKSYAKPLDSSQLLGRKLGDIVPGGLFGLAGYELQLTGGSDTAGFPLKKELEGSVRKKQLLKKGDVGAHIKRHGGIVRKTVRGNTINEFTAQVNLSVKKYGTKQVKELLGEKKEEVQTEAKPEEKKEVKEEVKVEEKKETVEKKEEEHKKTSETNSP